MIVLFSNIDHLKFYLRDAWVIRESIYSYFKISDFETCINAPFTSSDTEFKENVNIYI